MPRLSTLSPKWVASVLATAAVTIGSLAVAPAQVTASAPFPPYIPPTAPWLQVVNYYRTMVGVAPVTENTTWSAGAYNHSCYMLFNGISHDEVPGKPGYSLAGHQAGMNGNVAVSSVYGTSARSHIELWMTGPFHAIGVLRHNLTQVGFGKCDRTDTSPWKSGATLDVLRGVVSAPRPSTPILFPGHGTTTGLNQFITESPNPMSFCGWSGQAGLPLIAMMPEAVTSASSTVVGPSGALQTCTLTANNTSGVAKSILQGDNAVIVMPRAPLSPGTYQVQVTTNARTVNWSFTVDPAANTGEMPPSEPPPVATSTSDPSGLTLMAPVRMVDTRIQLGATPFTGMGSKSIQITGRDGVPADATAVLANVTVTDTVGSGYLTMWNCSAEAPVVSTLNYVSGDVVPNSASLPLSPDGKVCAFSLRPLQLIIDVTGFYSPSSAERYTPVAPTRIMDTRIPLGPSRKLAAGQVVELVVAGQAGVPANARGAALNVTSTGTVRDGYVTVWPCDRDQPYASNLNPVTGKTRANLVVTALSASGTVCLFAFSPTDLIVDVVGYLAPNGSVYTPSVPFRFTDTRDTRLEVNAGTYGARVAGGTVLRVKLAGVRGIPSNAKAVSANLTATDALLAGYLTAWPCGTMPTVSNLNYAQTVPVANASILPVSSSGEVCIFVATSAHVIIDVNGWWA